MSLKPLNKIVLASASPRRLELLRRLGLDVVIAPSTYPEPALPDSTPEQVAFVHAAEKARHVGAEFPDDVVLAADTVVDLDGKSLGKPRNTREATAMLRGLSGRKHDVHTAFALMWRQQCIIEVSTTTVHFYPLSPTEISAYVATGDSFDKAGGYGIQGRGAVLVSMIEGDFYTVMGLPLAEVIRCLPRLGFFLP